MSGEGNHKLSDAEVETIQIVSSIASAFSIIGSGFIIFCWFYPPFKHLRKFAFKLVCILSFVDFWNQLGDFLLPRPKDLDDPRQERDPDTLCLVQAYFESYFELSSVLWTTAIAATLYMSVFMRLKGTEIQDKMPYFVGVCFGIPLILTIIPGAIGAYGPAGAWCWITDDHEEWRFIQFFIPLWLAVIFNAVVYVRVINTISNTFKATGGADERTAAQMTAIINKLRYYPLILIVVWLFATINRTVEALNGGDEVFWLTLLQKSMSSLQGFLNALVYGFSAGVREALRGELAKVCSCVDPPQTVADQLVSVSPASPRVSRSRPRPSPVPPSHHTSPSRGVSSLDGIEMGSSMDSTASDSRAARIQGMKHSHAPAATTAAAPTAPATAAPATAAATTVAGTPAAAYAAPATPADGPLENVDI